MKMVIVLRNDISMSCGKAAAQAGHAAVECTLKALNSSKWRDWLDQWLQEGQKKVVLAAQSLEELEKLRGKAQALGLPVELIRDAGLTELEPGTATALCIGPGPDQLIDSVTGYLRLYK
ncbi:peptidyl-tRNA hydrolase Pth2 [Thermoproteus tenax]|uniref:Peptidyl-tRNA hydrolase n=1 Tax=Thermoproteus tenax (strain ATCC 35583 / DSM 2078 / JCM 9277 / NBRC 100435 / Kra 1) TaxID=768679 RepID=G4RPL9_THETK|nr:peptidyl-tRNA hydrolase Pth2 [Thermoproteus tenax]CCC81514.1 peptidyl-tRNA hydrolase [Thermoproteus tenax Kra 1]